MAASGVDATVSARAVKMKAGGSSHDHRTKIKTRFKNGKKIRVMHKLDEEQVRMMRQKANGRMSSAETAGSMGVSGRWVRKM